MKPIKEIEAEALEILKGEFKDKIPVKVSIIGLGPAYFITFEGDSKRLISDLLPKEILDKTFPVIRQMWE